MSSLAVVILIVIKVALTNSQQEETYKNVSQVLTHGKPKVFQQHLENRVSTRKQLEFNYFHFKQSALDKTKHLSTKGNTKLDRSLALEYTFRTIKPLSDETSKVLCGKMNKGNKINLDLTKLSHKLRKPQIESNNGLKLHKVSRREALCPLQKEKLVEIKSKINDAILGASAESNTCDLGNTHSNNCIQWFELIQCGIDRLESGVKVASSKSPDDIINKWEAVYKILIHKYEQEADVTRDFLSNKLKEEFDLIRSRMQALERVMRDIKREFRNSQTKMCIENISNGNIQHAVNYFQQIKRNSALIDITRIAYSDHGQLKNLKNIVDFGSALPACSQNLIVVVSLYELIKDNNQLESPHIMLFHKGLNHCTKNSSVEASLKTNTKKIIELWSNSIRNSEYNDVLTFMKGYANDIRVYYPEIIAKAYAYNLENTRTILNFIRDTPFIEDECVLLSALFENMKSNNNIYNNEVLMVAFRLKTIMEMKNYPTISEYYKNFATGLKSSFYSLVKNVIWDGVDCTFKNKHWNEYLYSPNNNWVYDSTRRRVFTWRPGGTVIEGDWSIIPENNAEYFVIKNSNKNEYLYAASEQYAHDSNRRNVFTWREGNPVIQGRWVLIPVDFGDYFVIKNKIHGEYLYAADDGRAWDGDRRRVFTWRGEKSNVINDDMKWEVIC